MKRFLFAVWFFCALAVQAAPGTYYIDYAGGNDANAGTSTGAAWKRAPGMVGFAGSYAHAAGDTFIFKGGVTWPASTLPLSITQSGTSSTRDTFKATNTWYTGASWTRPILDGELTANICIRVSNGARYLNLFDFDVRRAWLGGQGAGCISFVMYVATHVVGPDTIIDGYIGADNTTISNCWVHAWDGANPTSGNYYAGGIINWLNDYSSKGPGITNYLITHCTIELEGIDPWQNQSRGYAVFFAGDYTYNVMRNCGNGVIMGGGRWEFNEFDSCGGGLYGQGPFHGNWTYMARFDGTKAAPIQAGKVQIFANNYLHGKFKSGNEVIYIVAEQPQAAFSQLNYYIYNNVTDIIGDNNTQGTVRFAECDPYTGGASGTSAASIYVYMWNNTAHGEMDGQTVGVQGLIRVAHRAGYSDFARAYWFNNIGIHHGLGSADTGVTGTQIINSPNTIYSTVAAAASDGLSAANYWIPTLANNASIGAGINLSGTNLTTLHSTTTFGDLLAGAARPATGAWDNGAQQYGTGGATQDPLITSSTNAMANVGSPFSYTITALFGPTGFGASGLPTGLSCDVSTGVISGTPSGTVQVYTVTLRATNTFSNTQTNLFLDLQAASAQFQITPMAYDFGEIPTNTTADVTLALTNISDPSTTLTGTVTPPTGFSVVSGGSYSLAGGQGQNVVLRFTPTTVNYYLGQCAFSGSGGTNVNLSGGGAPVMRSFPFRAVDGLITNELFSVSGGVLTATSETTDPTKGGKAVYYISLTNETQIRFQCLVKAEADNSDSFFFAVDGEPATDSSIAANIWDVLPTTTGFETRTVHQRGLNGAYNDPEFTNKVWTLPAGLHKVVLRGREANAAVSNLTMSIVVEEPNPPSGPAKATSPIPANGALGVFPFGTVLSWLSDTNSSGHFVYWGETSPPTQLIATNISAQQVAAPNAPYGSPIYWRVDETNQTAGLLTTGDIWTFTTQSQAPSTGRLPVKNVRNLNIIILP